MSALTDWKNSKTQTDNEKTWQEILSKQKEILSEVKKDTPTIQKAWDRNQFGLMDAKIGIILLAEQARWYQVNGGDYASYETLWKIKSKDSTLSEFTMGEIARINYLLSLSYSSVSKIPLCKNNKNIGNQCLEVETEDMFNVDNVVAQLFHPVYWVSRAKAAYLLYFLTPKMMAEYNNRYLNNPVSWEKVLDSLCQVFSSGETNSSNNLLTRYLAWEAFRKHTCFANENELFNADVASEWWKNKINRRKVIDALEKSEVSPYCQQ